MFKPAGQGRGSYGVFTPACSWATAHCSDQLLTLYHRPQVLSSACCPQGSLLLELKAVRHSWHWKL